MTCIPASQKPLLIDAPTSRIIYPTVPHGAEDPAVRINVMRSIFNAKLPPRDRPRRLEEEGLFYEIETAFELSKTYQKITHGSQISRPLTADETAFGKKGTSQMILVPIGGGNYRELYMVYRDKKGAIYTVETKFTQRVDHHQLKPNLELAVTLVAS